MSGKPYFGKGALFGEHVLGIEHCSAGKSSLVEHKDVRSRKVLAERAEAEISVMARKSSKAPNKGARGLFRVTVNLKLKGFESVVYGKSKQK